MAHLAAPPFPQDPRRNHRDLLAMGRHRAADAQEIHQGALLRGALHWREGLEDAEVRMLAAAVKQLQGTWGMGVK